MDDEVKMRTHVAFSVTFGNNGNAEEFLLYGWHLKEPLFNWATGVESALCFPQFSAPYGCFVEMHVQPLIVADGPRSQYIKIAVNALTIGEMVLTGETVFAHYAPPLDWQSRRFVLTIRHPDAYAAASANIALAIALTRIRILVLDERMPPTRRRQLAPLRQNLENTLPNSGLSLDDTARSFTSLGANCEFGFVQRQMGAEPIDLLRFAGIPPIRLLYGIDNEFAGLEDPSNLRAESERVWDVRDQAYNIAYHTFLTADDMTWDELVVREVRRLRYLANKLINDIVEAEKVFVWFRNELVSEAEMMPLFLAMHRRGPARLLWVMEGDPQDGVKEIWPGLMIASISNLTSSTEHNVPGMFALWLPILLVVQADMLHAVERNQLLSATSDST